MTTPGSTRVTKPLGYTALKGWLRHRHPMIYLDRITDHEPGEFLTALLSVSGNLDCIVGHFPERAIYPGSHMIQAFAQCGIILYQMSTRPLDDNELTVIGSVEARFFKVVVPGDQLIFSVEVDRVVSNTFVFKGKAEVDGQRVAAFRSSLIRTRVEDMGGPLW